MGMLVDLLRKKADSKALGPMHFKVSQTGHAIPTDAAMNSARYMSAALRTTGKTETLRDRQVREAEERAMRGE